MVVGRAFGALAGIGFRAGKFTAKQAWRGAYHTHRFGMETVLGAAQGAANVARQATGSPAIDILSGATRTRGADLGQRIVNAPNVTRAGSAIIGGSNIAAKGAIDIGLAVGGLGWQATRVGSRAFKRAPRDLANPLGFEMKRGARWALGLGALGVGAGLGARDAQQQRRIGAVYPQGQMRELTYDAVPNVQPGADDLGATGDLVFALNNLR